jgi:predicted unusual protein kinase regulating ubiquinone biosynthesis (AarF/ABC1/UbiB family)
MKILPAEVGPDEMVAAQIKLVMDPLLDVKMGDVSLGELMKQNLQLAEQFGATSPRELVLVTKQLLYFERYAKELAPNYNMARDLFLVKNVFPDAVAAKAAAEGIEFPED